MRARVVAPLVAAVLGLAGGTVTALATGAGDQPDPAVRDPLGLGIALVRVDCAPGNGILILGYGDGSPALRAAMAENPGGDPSYLETAESCDTTYGPQREDDRPAYVVFLGPYDDLEEPCRLRMQPARRGDFVTNLRSGSTDPVKCVCVLPPSADRPTLRVGATPSDEATVWVRSLQGMLSDADSEVFPRAWVTGIYDQRTADRVAVYQDSSRSDSERGVVDDGTWRLLKTRLCGSYDF